MLTPYSLEQLQEWVADKEGIYVENQLLLTGKGKAVKQQTLAQEVCGLSGDGVDKG